VTSRRMLIWSAVGLGAAGAGGSLFRANHDLPPADPIAEQRFRELQDSLLARHGIPAESRFIETHDPPLRVHVIEAGDGEPLVFTAACEASPPIPRVCSRPARLWPDDQVRIPSRYLAESARRQFRRFRSR